MVEKAIIFLKSNSKLAIKPPKRKVIILKKLIKSIKEKKNKIEEVLWTKNKPAVTRVEEWTMAEIGVGADIAAGNQQDKGNWALLVKLHKDSITQMKKFM